MGDNLLPALEQPATSAIIFVHGYGANGADLLGIGHQWRAVLRQSLFLSPDGFDAIDSVQMGPQARQWFALQDFTLDEIERGLTRASAPFAHWLDQRIAQAQETQELSVAAPIFLFGFSQGAMLALDVACHALTKTPICGVLAYSGLLGRVPQSAAPDSPALFLTHGKDDPVVPFQGSQVAHDTLAQSQYQVALHPFAGVGHEISPEQLRLGLGFIQDRLASSR